MFKGDAVGLDMATGLGIRDFHKVEREVRYSNEGTIILSEIEHNAYRNALTLEITHQAYDRYFNLKTNPKNSHYGYVTLFRGSTVTGKQPIEFPKSRVFDILNHGIWNYHQVTESMRLDSVLLGNTVARYVNRAIEILSDETSPDAIWEVGEYSLVETVAGLPGIELLFPSYAGIDELPTKASDSNYTAFPIATPFPDLVKVKGDIPISFLFRLESWYLVNPVVYILSNPTDTEDSTDGEDEYPEPENTGGNQDDFPDDSEIPDGSDPRDHDDNKPRSRPFYGGQCPGVLYNVYAVRIRSNGNGPPNDPACEYFNDGEVQVATGAVGPLGAPQQEQQPAGPGISVTVTYLPTGDGGRIAVDSHFSGCPGAGLSVWRVQRVDGLPDNC